MTTSNSSTASLEAHVNRFIKNFSYDDISDKGMQAAQEVLMDQLGIEVGASELPWCKRAMEYAKSQSRDGASTIVADGEQVDAATAAFTNGTYGHGLEFDDAHIRSAGHPGCVVIPTSVALGEERDASIKDVLTAIVVGYEVYTRLGNLAAPDLLKRGWHPNAVLGTFGATASAASLLDFDEEMIGHAMAIATSHASGVTEYSSTGGSIKRVHGGMAARNGIESARMAHHGVTGPKRYLTGNKGFFNVFVERTDVSVDEFGTASTLEIEKRWLKPYACCGTTHAYIDAVHELDPDPERVERIVARVQPETNSIVGTANENVYRPEDFQGTQFSLPFQIALAVSGYGNGYRTHRKIADGDLSLDDTELLGLADTVEIEVSEELEEEYDPKDVGDLTIEYTDGTSEHAFVEDSLGTPRRPMSADQRRAKFDELTEPVLGSDGAQSLAAAIERVESLDSVAELTERTYR
jgi:2-methylcitrate dehydratase PrpD